MSPTHSTVYGRQVTTFCKCHHPLRETNQERLPRTIFLRELPLHTLSESEAEQLASISYPCTYWAIQIGPYIWEVENEYDLNAFRLGVWHLPQIRGPIKRMSADEESGHWTTVRKAPSWSDGTPIGETSETDMRIWTVAQGLLAEMNAGRRRAFADRLIVTKNLKWLSRSWRQSSHDIDDLATNRRHFSQKLVKRIMENDDNAVVRADTVSTMKEKGMLTRRLST